VQVCFAIFACSLPFTPTRERACAKWLPAPIHATNPNSFNPRVGSSWTSLLTVIDAARDLSLTINESCPDQNATCIATLAQTYTGPGNVLVCTHADTMVSVARLLDGLRMTEHIQP